MPNHTSFRLNRSGMLLALISAAFAGEAAAATGGRVDFATAGATVAGSDGQQRPLAKGTELGTGDTVRTDAAARAQIRFTDGSYVSLQPNTEFAIKEYNYEGKTDGSERGFFGLAKGAMRTVTGLVGRVNRNRYQIATPTATVGIRGTGGRIEVLLDGSTLIAGTSGIWTLTNPSGTLDVPAGTFGKAPSAPNQPPQKTSQGPDTGPAPLPNDPPKPLEPKGIEKQIDSTCQTSPTAAGCINSLTNQTTTPPTPIVPLVTGSGYHVSYAYGDVNGSPPSGISNSTTLANATFDAAGRMTQFSGLDSATFSGTHQEFGTAGGMVAWGRWTGPVNGVLNDTTVNLNPGTNQGFHYVVGIPATAMPMTGGPANFTFVGATKPTGSDGTFAPGTFSGTMTVTDWARGGMSLTAALAFAGFTYSLSGTASFSAGSAPFTGTMTGNVSAGTAPSGYACSSGCTASVNGAFFGAGAAFAGYAYKVASTISPTQSVTGVAVFKQ
jgi:FecR protein